VNVLTFKIHKTLGSSLFIIDYKKTKIDEKLNKNIKMMMMTYFITICIDSFVKKFNKIETTKMNKMLETF
jgi:hypothetical protein